MAESREVSDLRYNLERVIESLRRDTDSLKALITSLREEISQLWECKASVETIP